MKRNLLIALMFVATAGLALAQIGAAPATDVLGAHLNYGRGCAGCHAPHSGAYGNGAAKTADPLAGSYALWGEDVGSLYGKVIAFGDSGKYQETLPSNLTTTNQPDVAGILLCLSCHDGNYAKGAMMKNAVYETLPSTYGTYAKPPTLLGNDGTTLGNYTNDHPVGSEATIGCNTPATGQTFGESGYNWDCSISATGVITPGPNMMQFINNYGWFVSPGVMNNKPVVLCTTCHNQHLMNVVAVTQGSTAALTFNATTPAALPSKGLTGLPSGSYATMFFIRAPYNPADTNIYTNQTAQFCRQCHGGESNEMNGGTAGTVF
jgi:hypothetical protein